MDKPKLHGIAQDMIKASQYFNELSHRNNVAEAVPENTVQTKSEPKYTVYEGNSDPFHTIIVTRLPYSMSERRLKREFERFGAIRSISMINTPDGKPRGYAFIEYERERDARVAYKEGDQMVLEGEDGKARRVLVDVERGRTVSGWKPRRVGGGLGNTRRGPRPMCSAHRDPSASSVSVRRPSQDATAAAAATTGLNEPKRARIQYDDIY